MSCLLYLATAAVLQLTSCACDHPQDDVSDDGEMDEVIGGLISCPRPIPHEAEDALIQQFVAAGQDPDTNPDFMWRDEVDTAATGSTSTDTELDMAMPELPVCKV